MFKRILSVLLIAVLLVGGIALAEDEWVCESCGKTATGKFCGKCGAKKPASDTWTCPECGKELSSELAFCTECGAKKAGRDWYCAQCATFNPGENGFCRECGAAVETGEFFVMKWNKTINHFKGTELKKRGSVYEIDTWTNRENYLQYVTLRFPLYMNEGDTYYITSPDPFAYFYASYGGITKLLIYGELTADGFKGKADYYKVVLTRKETVKYTTILEGTIEAAFNKGADTCFGAFRLSMTE